MTTDAPAPAPVSIRFEQHQLDALNEAAEEADRSLSYIVRAAVDHWRAQRDADRARLDSPEQPPLVDVTGPWGSGGEYHLQVDGVPVPYIAVHKTSEWQVTSTSGEVQNGEARYVLTCDNRFQTSEMSWGELWTQAWFWAQAMAVAAGWTCHGQNARRSAPHGGEWADTGWQIMEQVGQLGAAYEVRAAFRLPNMGDADQVAHHVEDRVVEVIGELGGRDTSTALVRIGPLEDRRPRIDLGALTAASDGTSSAAHPQPPGANIC